MLVFLDSFIFLCGNFEIYENKLLRIFFYTSIWKYFWTTSQVKFILNSSSWLNQYFVISYLFTRLIIQISSKLIIIYNIQYNNIEMCLHHTTHIHIYIFCLQHTTYKVIYNTWHTNMSTTHDTQIHLKHTLYI